MRLLQQLKDKADIILCIYAGDIAKRKVRADFGITYDTDALKMIDDLNLLGCLSTLIKFDSNRSYVIGLIKF
jgi:uncharacterized protein (UPF0371 family)